MDIISKLPDLIRSHIVCFLSMEDAIRTSALSKEWRNVPSSLRWFEFKQDYFERKTNGRYDFNDFVDQTVCRHDGSSIRSFSLSVNAKDLYDDPQIISWITFAIKYKVKSLKIHIPKFNSLPDCLFTCETLTDMFLWDVTLNIPAELKLPMLKSLVLYYVKFNGNEQVNRLVLNCLSLNSLKVSKCLWNNIDDLIIHALNLKTLSVYPCCAHNVTVHSLHLTKFSYQGHPPDISSESLSSLLDISFSCPSYSIPESTLTQNVVDRRVSKIVMGLSNVVDLSLDEFWMKFLSRTGAILSNQTLSFCCLKYLDVMMLANKSQVNFMALLLRTSPNLITLDICFMGQDENPDMLNVGVYCHQQKLSDEVSLESLENVTIGNFEGSDGEFYLVRYLLGKAKILKEIQITCSYIFDEDEPEMRRITERITQIVAVSPYVTTTIFSQKEVNIREKTRYEDFISRVGVY